MKKTLIYGYGNPGRQDDGLGIVLVEMLRKLSGQEKFENVDFDTNYQLNIEDAETISKYDKVIFVDASTENIENYRFTRVNPSDARVEFTMHAVSPAFVLNLCNDIFKKFPETYLLHIKGYKWDFKEGISGRANDNVKESYDFLKNYLSAVPCKKDVENK